MTSARLSGIVTIGVITALASCRQTPAPPPPAAQPATARVIQTNATASFAELGRVQSGERLATTAPAPDHKRVLEVLPGETGQEILGFGASFTESSAWNLATLPTSARQQVMRDLFDPAEGAGFTLARTHIGSSDYSNGHYAYIEAPGESDDATMATFSIAPDERGFTGDENDQVRGVLLETPDYDLIPMIREALEIQPALKIVASPWSAPAWMKTNGSYVNGTLKPEHRRLWARYLSAYLSAYRDKGIPIWALTPQNEPLHYHDARWDSMGWEAEDMRDFIRDDLGPQLESDGLITPDDWSRSPVRLLAFDHNKQDMNAYLDTLYADPATSRFVWGSAFHWYPSSELAEHGFHTDALDRLRTAHPGKAMLHTESSIDIQAEHPVDQYFGPSTDWLGTFVPFETYAIDIISDLNHGAQGYIEWCMVLSHEGKPNPYDNFNSAPILVNPATDEVIKTPLYFVLRHFSQFIRPGAVRIGLRQTGGDTAGLVHTAARNPDGSVVIVMYNRTDARTAVGLVQGPDRFDVVVDPRSVQTVVLRAGAGEAAPAGSD